jgi:hypothetical protein
VKNKQKAQQMKTQLSDEEMKAQRLDTLEKLEIKKYAFELELEDRKKQVKTGIVTETSDSYKGGLKPVWLMKVHVKQQEYELNIMNKQIEEINKLLEND